GALKLKELAYMHAEGFAAGELKHGPIALIEDGTPVICVVPSPAGRGVLHDKIVSNIQEVRARGARTIVIAEEGDEAVLPYADHVIAVPKTPTLLAPLVTTVPLPILAAEVATARGRRRVPVPPRRTHPLAYPQTVHSGLDSDGGAARPRRDVLVHGVGVAGRPGRPAARPSRLPPPPRPAHRPRLRRLRHPPGRR